MPESLLDAVAAEKEEAITKQDREAYEGKHTTIYDDDDWDAQDTGGRYNDVKLCRV